MKNRKQLPSHESLKLLGEIPKYQSFSGLKAAVLLLFDLMAESRNSEENADEIPSWPKTVREYIETNYNNPDMNIASLADQYNLTPAYFSRLYRKYTNTGITDYINLIRVEQAKSFSVKMFPFTMPLFLW